MKKKEIENRGGKRKGSGAKKKEPTKTISFRVKLDKIEPIKKMVKEFLDGKE